MQITRWLTASLSAVLLLLPAGGAQAAEAGTIRLGQIGLSFYAVTAGVVQEVLED